MTERCTIITVTYHTGEVLLPALEGMLKQRGLAKLVVVNNGNPPEVEAKLKDMAQAEPRITLLTGHGNIGFGAGCNLGAKEAATEYLAFINPDVLLLEPTLEPLMQMLDVREDAVMAGPRLLFPDGFEQAGGRRNLLTPDTVMNEMLGWHIITGNQNGALFNLHRAEEDGKTREIPAISGAFMVMLASAFGELGGFDEGYFLHVEDLDLCYRIAQAGKKILYVPSLEVVHACSTSNISSRKVEWWKCQSFCRYFTLHFKGRTPWYQLWGIYMGALARFAVKEGLKPLIRWKFRRSHRRLRQSLRRYLWLYRYVYLEQEGLHPVAQPKQMKTVFLTGATTQIAIALMARLLREGVQVVALWHHEMLPFKHPCLHLVQGDMEQDRLPFGDRKAEFFINTVPLPKLKTSHVVQFAEQGGKQVIAFSSTSITGKEDSRTQEEIDLVRALEHGEANLATVCDRMGITRTILRPTLVYGLGIDRNIMAIASFVRRFGFFPLNDPAEGKRQPVHADDLAQAVLQVAGNPQCFNKTYDLSGGETLSYKEMAARVMRASGQEPKFWISPHLPMIMDMLSHLTGNININGDIARRMNKDLAFEHVQAANDFGYAPRPFTVEKL